MIGVFDAEKAGGPIDFYYGYGTSNVMAPHFELTKVITLLVGKA